MKQVAIVGGGLAGLISSIELSKKGVPCILFEKKQYPFHRVCGEYISNEAVPFLKKTGLYPENLNPALIGQFQLSSVRGQSATMPLDLGGFGISRYSFDDFLHKKAESLGVKFYLGGEVDQINFEDDKFVIRAGTINIESDLVIGAFGKRSKLDVHLQRDFITKRSPYIGVKYHAKTEQPKGLISLHNFHGGYCGIAHVEDDITNICYLARRESLQEFGNITDMEQHVLFSNPLLRNIFSNAEFLMKKPLVINEISFETKEPVEDHILMAGDAAGMIAPLCGNGMAMAIHAAKIVSDLTTQFCRGKISRDMLERSYEIEWKKTFANRLRTGRTVQRLFGNALLSNLAVKMTMYSRPLSKVIMKNTHGEEF